MLETVMSQRFLSLYTGDDICLRLEMTITSVNFIQLPFLWTMLISGNEEYGS